MDLLGPKVIAKGALTTARTGMLQGKTIGNPAQLGGAMVIDRGGRIVWSRHGQGRERQREPARACSRRCGGWAESEPAQPMRTATPQPTAR